MNLHNILKKQKKKSVMIFLVIIFISVFSLGLFTISFAYISVMADNEVIKTNGVNGEATEIAKPTFITNIERLRLNLTTEIMSNENRGNIYYATETGVPVTEATLGSGKYTLSIASVASGDVIYDCNYTYNVRVAVDNEIKDKSDEDVFIAFIDPSGNRMTYSLKDIMAGVTYTGKINGLNAKENQTIEIEAYVKNTNIKQNDLSGNKFIFFINNPLGEEGFNCSESSLKKN